MIGQPRRDPAVTRVHLLKERHHRLGPRPVQIGGLAVDIAGVQARSAQPGHDGLGALPRGRVVGGHGLGGHAGHGERERHHYTGPVLARRAVNQRRALGAGDAAHRPHHLMGAVFQVAQVVPADRVARIPGLVLPVPGQQRVGDHIGVGSHLGQHRVVSVPYARDGVQRRRALGRELVGAAQVHHGGHADVVHQFPDVSSRQVLQVIRAQQPGPCGLLPVLGGQVPQVAHVDRTLKLNPRHDNTFADPLEGCGPGGALSSDAAVTFATSGRRPGLFGLRPGQRGA